MTLNPPELPGNTDVPVSGVVRMAYPFQIPLRAMIPQKVDPVGSQQSIATSHIAAAAYRVHSFEWSAGAGAGTTAALLWRKRSHH